MRTSTPRKLPAVASVSIPHHRRITTLPFILSQVGGKSSSGLHHFQGMVAGLAMDCKNERDMTLVLAYE